MAPAEPTIERIHALETDVSLLKRDSQVMTASMEKILVTSDRLATMVEAISRTSAVHDEKFHAQDKTNANMEWLIDERKHDIQAHEDRMVTTLENLKLELINTINDKLHPPEEEKKPGILQAMLDNWKYFAIGAAFATGVVTHKWGLFSTLFGAG